MQPIIINIKTQQIYPDHSKPVITELTTEGTLERTDEGYALRYKESAITGMDNTETTFFVRDDSVMLTRRGDVNNEMVFQRGRRFVSLYNTPYGAMTTGVTTHSLNVELDETGGTLDIRYDMEMENQLVSTNKFLIQVKERVSQQ